jgi:hypothetical protein
MLRKQANTHQCLPQSDAELMMKEQVLGFQSAARLE